MKLPTINRRDRVLLVGMLAVAIVASLLTMLVAPPAREGSLLQQPSSYFNERYGTKAGFLVLQRLGYDVRRLRRPVDHDTLHEFDTLFLPEPVVGLEDYEEKALLEWVWNGHVLVTAPGRSARQRRQRRPFQAGETAASKLDPWFNIRGDNGAKHRTQTVDTIDAVAGRELSGLTPAFRGVERLSAPRGRRFVHESIVRGALADAEVEEIWNDELGVMAVAIKYGQGRIVAFADAFPITNRVLGRPDHGLLLANLAGLGNGTPQKRTIAFDEFHLGFEEHDAPWTAVAALIWDGPWALSIVQAALVGALALFGAGVRFGRPHDVMAPSRRHHGEFARSAGRILHDAGAAGIAYSTLIRHYRGDLCRRLHLGVGASDSAVAQALSRHGAAGLLEALEPATLAKRVGRADVLRMARTMHEGLKSIEHGT